MLALIARAADPGDEQHASTETTQLYAMLDDKVADAEIRAARPTAGQLRACPVDHGTGSRSQIRIDATSTVPWYMNSRLS